MTRSLWLVQLSFLKDRHEACVVGIVHYASPLVPQQFLHPGVCPARICRDCDNVPLFDRQVLGEGVQGRLGGAVRPPRRVALECRSRSDQNDAAFGLTQVRNDSLDLVSLQLRVPPARMLWVRLTNASGLNKLISYNLFHSSTEDSAILIGSRAAWLITIPSIWPPNFTARSVILVAFWCRHFNITVPKHILLCNVPSPGSRSGQQPSTRPGRDIAS